MSVGETMDEAPNSCLGARCKGAQEALVLAMLVYGFALSSAARAAEPGANVVKNMQPLVGGTPIPMDFLPDHGAAGAAPAMDSRRRSSDGIDAGAYETEPALQSRPLQVDSPWQHFADYRSQGRIQVLTLWASPRNMISVQAGKHGVPTLQWSSRVMNRGGATRGVLDKLVASSLVAAGVNSKMAHGSSAAPVSKPLSPTPTSRYP
jgi:hypothetical protein